MSEQIVHWLVSGTIVGLGLYLVSLVAMVIPWRRQRTLEIAMVVPFSREHVWRAYFANQVMRTPGVSFETAQPDMLIEFDARVGAGNEHTCTMTARVMANEPRRLFALHVLTYDGAPYPGGPQSVDGVMLEDAPGGRGTRVTIFLHVETPDLMHARLMRRAILITLAKLRRRLEASGAPLVSPPGM